MNTQFVDWLSVSQVHSAGTVRVFGSEFRIATDLHTGELVREQVVAAKHEGSYDSSLRIRSDGAQVSVSGNPSAFDRPDNLFGWLTLRAAVDRVNHELQHLGLPDLDTEREQEHLRLGCSVALLAHRDANDKPFAIMREGIRCNGGWYTAQGRQYAHLNALVRDRRARISRVDITENLATNGAADFIRHLSSYVHRGKIGNLYPNGMTVDWGGSRRVYTKYYVKAHDLELRIKELQRHARGQDAARLEDHLHYLDKLKGWCEDHQIVRRETSLKSTELIDRNLIYLEAWDGEDMTNIIRPYQFHNKLNLEETRFTGIRETLEARGIPAGQAKKAELVHTSWVNGGDVKTLAGSPRTFRRYRQILLSVGVDIANPCDLSRITLRAHRGEWREIDPPEWYVLPDHLRAVA